MTTPLEEVIRKVVDDWVDRPNGHVAQHIARAVLAHLAERREQPPAEGGTWTPRGFVAALTRERDSLKAENEILTAQAAGHSASVLEMQVRMLKLVDALTLIVDNYGIKTPAECTAFMNGIVNARALLAETGGR